MAHEPNKRPLVYLKEDLFTVFELICLSDSQSYSGLVKDFILSVIFRLSLSLSRCLAPSLSVSFLCLIIFL